MDSSRAAAGGVVGGVHVVRRVRDRYGHLTPHVGFGSDPDPVSPSIPRRRQARPKRNRTSKPNPSDRLLLHVLTAK